MLRKQFLIESVQVSMIRSIAVAKRRRTYLARSGIGAAFSILVFVFADPSLHCFLWLTVVIGYAFLSGVAAYTMLPRIGQGNSRDRKHLKSAQSRELGAL